jgi:glycosyltransferase involved in cell wall biosynthesis
MIASPRVSVAVPSYQHERYIRQAIESVLSQSIEDLECVVVDDGSRDGSVEILRSIRDPRLRVIVQEHQGAHVAIDRAIREGRAPIVAILNSDDLFHPERLAEALAVLEREPGLRLVATWIQVIDADGKTLGTKHGYDDLLPVPIAAPDLGVGPTRDFALNLLASNFVATTSNMVFPRAVYERLGPVRPLRYAHDWDFALRCAADGACKLVESPLLFYRVHQKNTIRENEPAMVFEICLVLACHLRRILRSHGLPRLDVARRAEVSARLCRSISAHGREVVLAVLLAVASLYPEGEEEALLDEALAPESALREELTRVIRDARPPDPSPAKLGSRVRRLFARLLCR